MLKSFLRYVLVFVGFVMLTVACGGGKSSISVMPSLEEFEQSTNADIKIDILFVIDDSGSMRPVQENLRDNFQSFINEFYGKGFDFRVAVAKTSAYGTPTTQTSGGQTYYESGRTVHEFRCGAGNNCGAGVNEWGRACTGSYGNQDTTNGNGTPGSGTDHILSSLTLSKTEMVTKFSRNADVGLCGSGDERGIESTETVLRNMATVYMGAEKFPRPDSHLAVIHVGDEPDGKWSSASSSNGNGSLNAHSLSGISQASGPGEEAENEVVVQEFVAALGAHEPTADVSVHAIQNLDTSCSNPASYIGYPQLYMSSIADGLIFGGTVGIRVCDDFGSPLAALSDHISSLASTFELSEQLDAQADGNLKVFVEGLNGNNPIPRSTDNGFEYDIGTNSITFYGSMVPPQGALIGLQYTCATLNCE